MPDAVDSPLEIDAAALDELRRAGEPHTVLDVREAWEVTICALEGSLAIPMNEIPERLAEIPADSPLVVVCHHGARSLNVTMWLRGQGYDRAVSLAGGIDAWARQFDPGMSVY
jgi:rhodanese-related sulfurtransferase